MLRPSLPSRTRPAANGCHVLVRTVRPPDVHSGDRPHRYWWYEPAQHRLSTGDHLHGITGCGIAESALQNQAKTNEMHANGLDALQRRLSRMLHRECIDRLTMRRGKRGIRVFASQHFAIHRPATRRRLHVAMSRPLHGRHRPAATHAGHQVRYRVSPQRRAHPATG